MKKVPGTFKKKEAALVIHRIKVLGTTNSLALQGFNTVDRVFFPCVFFISWVHFLLFFFGTEDTVNLPQYHYTYVQSNTNKMLTTRPTYTY